MSRLRRTFHYGTSHQDPDIEWVTNYRPSRRVAYDVATHYHPYTDELIERLNIDGLDALLDARFHATLTATLDPSAYEFGSSVRKPYPIHDIDLSDDGAYSIYNWELFFHAPVLIATHLSKNQRFAEAQRWFHYVFDPTSNEDDIPAPARFWRFLRFRNETSPEFIGEMLTRFADGENSELKTRIETAIAQWRDRPFRPHGIARTRALAYQVNVIMKYIDNLVAWGDSLFRQDTIESMNEATQVYVLASQLLGPKPQQVPRQRTPPRMSYAQLKTAGIDSFGNALVELENEFPFNTTGLPGQAGNDATAAFGIGRSLYFCVPPNATLLAYWDKVADRLFKLRHCRNIEGIVRQPALFDPPIDPGALVRAAAAGIDIASIVNNVNQPVSIVRGPLLLRKAQELCAEVKALGGAALSAVEKQESEQLASLLRSHQLRLLNLGRDVRFLQWKEAESATEALLHSRSTAWERYRHYRRILGMTEEDINATEAVELVRQELTEDTFDDAYAALVEAHTTELDREAYRRETSVGGLMEFAGQAVVSVVGGEVGMTLPLNKNEHAELNIFLPTADLIQRIATIMKIAVPIMGLIPQFGAAAKPMGVGAEIGFGGQQLAQFARTGAEVVQDISNAFKDSAHRASKMASYYRRAEDYVLQANLATSELEQYGRQIVSSLIREQILKREYDNQLAQIEQNESAEAFHSAKFTTAELYGWMHAQLSHVHYECYKLAFDVAKRAEQTLAYELMRPEFDAMNIIQFGYWDAGRKGLVAGERLSLDLQRLELAYLEYNRREYEMTKHVSLARLDPRALLRLRANGACEVEVPEWLFDLDSPGQYMRRIKTVSLSIPAITGPYTSIHAKLSLLRSTVRTSSLSGDQYARDGVEDSRFRDYAGAIQSIVTSSAQDDTGTFGVNLRDERRLPFEGAGAASTWRIEIPTKVPQFDIETISDVVLHIKYTAREAGHLSDAATNHVNEDILEQPDTLEQLFALPHMFADAWYAFRSAPNDGARVLQLAVSQDHFPYWTQRLGIDDAVVATFAVTDRDKKRLSLAPASVPLAGESATGWTLTIDNTSAVFAFLKKYQNEIVYMTLSYRGLG